MEEEDKGIPRNTEEDGRLGSDLQGMKMKTSGSRKTGDKETTTKKKKKKYWMGCLRAESDESGNVDLTVDFPGERTEPTHLVVMVNGLIGSAQNWRFAAKQMLKKYPQDLLVHCSKRNHSTQTFDGVDVMGERLAQVAAEALGAISLAGNVDILKKSLILDPAQEVRETCELALKRIEELSNVDAENQSTTTEKSPFMSVDHLTLLLQPLLSLLSTN